MVDEPFTIHIEGYAPIEYIPTLIEGIKALTPEDGGFTFRVGTTTSEAAVR
jgi:hypothetical protein